MKPKGSLLPLLCVFIGLLALSTASAQAKTEVLPGRYVLSIELPESDGWDISILAYNHREVYLRAQRGLAYVFYRAAGRVSSQRVEANFGALGRIDLALDLEARGTGVPRLHGRCKGRSPYELTGSFHGVIDFPGEPNLVSVSARRGKATILRSFRRVCQPKSPFGPIKKALPFTISWLGARSHESGRTTEFQALGLNIENELLLGIVGGRVHEHLEGVNIVRSNATLSSEKELSFTKPGAEPERVEVKPGSPFTGKASFLKPAGEPSRWSGDLSVPVPGGGLVSLAGPNFHAYICRPHSPFEIAECKPRLDALSSQTANALLDLYGSGSHSQPLALARLSSLR